MYEVVGVLHRDLSVDNVMFYYDKGNKVVGILADWDLSSTKKGPGCLRDPADNADVMERLGDEVDPNIPTYLPTPKTRLQTAD